MVNGTGRDTYIGFNMGSNTIGNFPTKAPVSGSFGSNSFDKHFSKHARSPERTTHYKENGTGRDSYIFSNHGGFASNYNGDRKKYVDSLRNYDKQTYTVRDVKPTGGRRDHFVEG